MSTIEFYNCTRQKISGKDLLLVVRETFKKMRRSESGLNLILVGKRRIQTLNRIYRHKDQITDVLSFEVKKDAWPMMPEEKNFLGEIFICVDRARSQAKKFDHSLEKELAILTTHGVLHLLGLTHKQMEDKGWLMRGD